MNSRNTAGPPKSRWLMLLLTSFHGYCADAPIASNSRDNLAIRRDSAGILIVENTDSLNRFDLGLRLTEHPSLEIGCQSCEGGGVSFGLIMDVVTLPDGRIAVLDLYAKQVRVFASDGTVDGSIGRAGKGPGEFELPDRLAILTGDSIIVHDQGSFQQQVFSLSGIYARSIPDPRIEEWGPLRSLPRGWLPDGRFFIAEEINTRKLPHLRGTASAEWRMVNSDGSQIRTVARLPAKHGQFQPPAGPYEVDGTTMFSPRPTYATDSTGFWYAFPSTYELRHYLPNGAIDRIIRRHWVPEPVPHQLVSRAREWRKARYSVEVARLSHAGRARAAAELDALAFADTLPAFRRLVVTKEGGVWVERYPPASAIDLDRQDRYGPSGYAEWTIFAPDGMWRGTITLPDRFVVHEIGADYVLGVWRDELDVQYVRKYRLVPASDHSR